MTVTQSGVKISFEIKIIINQEEQIISDSYTLDGKETEFTPAVYVVEKIAENAHPVTEYVSTKSFLVLRRESLVSAGFSNLTAPFVEDFSDYRSADGVMIPFKTTAAIRGSGGSITTVKSVKFNIEMPDFVFRATRTTMDTLKK
ncbi:MAG: hypothetical protein ACR2HT_02075 [Pyrinomonadaceae bacterium]|jgi:hypothetical protein